MRINFAQSKSFLGNITHRQVILPVAKFHLLFNDTAGDIDFYYMCLSRSESAILHKSISYYNLDRSVMSAKKLYSWKKLPPLSSFFLPIYFYTKCEKLAWNTLPIFAFRWHNPSIAFSDNVFHIPFVKNNFLKMTLGWKCLVLYL